MRSGKDVYTLPYSGDFSRLLFPDAFVFFKGSRRFRQASFTLLCADPYMAHWAGGKIRHHTRATDR